MDEKDWDSLSAYLTSIPYMSRYNAFLNQDICSGLPVNGVHNELPHGLDELTNALYDCQEHGVTLTSVFALRVIIDLAQLDLIGSNSWGMEKTIQYKDETQTSSFNVRGYHEMVTFTQNSSRKRATATQQEENYMILMTALPEEWCHEKVENWHNREFRFAIGPPSDVVAYTTTEEACLMVGKEIAGQLRHHEADRLIAPVMRSLGRSSSTELSIRGYFTSPLELGTLVLNTKPESILLKCSDPTVSLILF